MTITYEIGSLREFKFWGHATDNFNLLRSDEIDRLDDFFNSEDCRDISAEWLNDIFAYYFESVCDMLGLDEDEVLERAD